MLLPQDDPHDWAGVDTIRLEDLWCLANVFRMSDHDTDGTCSSAVCHFHPVLTRTRDCGVYKCTCARM